VQAAREAARRMQCSNYLKQWGISFHTFHDAQNRFPSNGYDKIWWAGYKRPGTRLPIDGALFYSWRSLLLPYMEQNAMYSELNTACEWLSSQNPYPTGTYPSGSGSEDDYATGAALDDATALPGMALPWTWRYGDPTLRGKQEHPGGEFFPSLGCPSDGEAKKVAGATNPCSYVGCNGDSLIGFSWGEQGRTMAARGIIKPGQDYNDDSNHADTFTNGSHGEVGIESITDGTSNTMIVSETAVGTVGGDRNIKRGVAANGTAVFPNFQSNAEGCGRPSDCAAVRGPGNTIRDEYGVLNSAKASRWLDARSIYALYKAVLPPNSPSCVNTDANNDNEAVRVANAISASSYHTGGVNVCMADGAVRFVSDSVDPGNSNLKLGASFFPDNTPPPSPNAEGYLGGNPEPHRWMGESTYGVWGALATPAHGESKSL